MYGATNYRIKRCRSREFKCSIDNAQRSFYRAVIGIFAARCYANAALAAVLRCLSVRLCVCHVREFRQNEKKTDNQFFSPFHCSSFTVLNVMAIFRRRPPNGCVECRWGIAKISNLDEYLALRSLTAASWLLYRS